MQPNYSPEALYHPERVGVFQDINPLWIFQTHIQEFSLINAWWLSNIAHLTYFEHELLQLELSKIGLKLTDIFSGVSTWGFLIEGEGFAVLAFRGTEAGDMDDFITNINFPLVNFNGNAKVHGGFLAALNNIWHPIERHLIELERKKIKVWFTGHSLGAALATLAAARKKPTALFTFGSPRVGNEEFALLLNNTCVCRLVNCCDIVATLPFSGMGYSHVGEEFFITAGGEILKNPSLWRKLRNKTYGLCKYAALIPVFHSTMVNLRSLVDHSIVNYTAGLWRQLQKVDGRK